MTRFDTRLASQRWEACISLANEEIPAFAVVQVIGANLFDAQSAARGEPALYVRKTVLSDEDSVQLRSARGHRYRFNGPVPIPANGTGYVTKDMPAVALCHSLLGLPVPSSGNIFAPMDGQWYLEEIVSFTGLSEVTEFLNVFRMAMPAPVVTSQPGCHVGWFTLQSVAEVDK